jgi:hypothetical protein
VWVLDKVCKFPSLTDFSGKRARFLERSIHQLQRLLKANCLELGNFVKNSSLPPAPGWPLYQPSNNLSAVANLAYQGNVALDDVAQTVPSGPLDAVCTTAWDAVLVIPLPGVKSLKRALS